MSNHRVLKCCELYALGFSTTNAQKHLILRAIDGQLREEDVEPARTLADIIAAKREEITEASKTVT